MTRKHVRLALAAALLFGLCAACNFNVGSPQAQVNCQGQQSEYVCQVTHTSGPAGEVCWDVKMTCANGTVTSANACAHVSPGGTSERRVPLSAFPEFPSCDSVAGLEIIDRTGT
jgi:hypothetical protein